jgi:hypothetical protein
LADGGAFGRSAQVVALGQVAAEGLELGELGWPFDAFGDDLEAEAASELKEGGEEVALVGLDVEGVDEGAVDLQDAEGEAGQVGQRGVADAEVVEGELDAEGVEAAATVPAAWTWASSAPSVISRMSWPAGT